jgi:hypothetical protein
LALAFAGMIVLAPSPWNPPRIPQQSSVGRAQIRSSVVYPTSPQVLGAPVVRSHSFSSKGRAAISARSAAVSGSTSS